MYLKLSLVLGVWISLIELTAQLEIIGSFCLEGDCYIRLENGGRSWSDAQQMCSQYNSTLPIVDNPQRKRTFDAALINFRQNGADVWLGANASDYGSLDWRWLDGRQYSAAMEDAGIYEKSYAFLLERSSEVLAYGSVPYNNHTYICQYNTVATDVCTNGTRRLALVNKNQCFVKYDEKLSWFNARNNCLENKGDLASFSNISLLNGVFDSFGSWVGLRHSQWNWQNAVTGLSSDVTFTSWRSNQPNDAIPTCISIDSGDFPNWKDWDCSREAQYICQMLNTTSTLSTQETHSSEFSTILSTARGVTTESLGSAGFESENEAKVTLAIGLGVGLGCALIIVIIIAIVVIVVRSKQRNHGSNEDSKSEENFQRQNGRICQEEEANELNEISHHSKSSLDGGLAYYATVKITRDPDAKSHHITSSIRKSQLDGAPLKYATLATVMETSNLEQNSENTATTNQSEPHAYETLPNYDIVNISRSVEPISNHTESSICQSLLDDTSHTPIYGIVQKSKNLETNYQLGSVTRESNLGENSPDYSTTVQETEYLESSSHNGTNGNGQSQFHEEASPNCVTFQKTGDLQPIFQDITSSFLTFRETEDLRPISQNTTNSSSQTQLDDASQNSAATQEVGGLLRIPQHTATNAIESQLDDISPIYATVQESERRTQDSQPSAVYAVLQFCQERL